MSKTKIFILIFFLFLPLFGFAIETCHTGFRVPNNTSRQINCHQVCRIVRNNCGADIFVPPKTSGEWAEFRANHPACVSLETCLTPTPHTDSD